MSKRFFAFLLKFLAAVTCIGVIGVLLLVHYNNLPDKGIGQNKSFAATDEKQTRGPFNILPMSLVPPPAEKLPAGSTIESIITKIIEHGDLRDRSYIQGLFGIVPGSCLLGFYYVNNSSEKSANKFSISYSVQPSMDIDALSAKDKDALRIMYGDLPVAYMEWKDLPQKQCIKYNEFDSLFNANSKITGNPQILTKELHPPYFFTLIETKNTRGDCVREIEIVMKRRITNAP